MAGKRNSTFLNGSNFFLNDAIKWIIALPFGYQISNNGNRD